VLLNAVPQVPVTAPVVVEPRHQWRGVNGFCAMAVSSAPGRALQVGVGDVQAVLVDQDVGPEVARAQIHSRALLIRAPARAAGALVGTPIRLERGEPDRCAAGRGSARYRIAVSAARADGVLKRPARWRARLPRTQRRREYPGLHVHSSYRSDVPSSEGSTHGGGTRDGAQDRRRGMAGGAPSLISPMRADVWQQPHPSLACDPNGTPLTEREQ